MSQLQTTPTTAATAHAPGLTAADGDTARRTVAPAVDIFETKTDVWLHADVPGVARDALAIEVKDGEVAVRGRPVATRFDDVPFDFVRAFRLPPGIDIEHISAELKDGVLKLRLPKSEGLRPRTIPVTTH